MPSTCSPKPLLYDLFSGAGGACRGYQGAGFEVWGIDSRPQPRYCGDRFIQMDAFAFVERVRSGAYPTPAAWHASPPCQSFTAYRRKGHGVGDGYADLVGRTRRALRGTGRPYVIENVVGAPLPSAIRLCGSSFGLDVRRHRLFETSWPCLAPPCEHGWQTPRFPPASNRTNARRTVEIGVWRIPLAEQQAAMGIHWMTLEELSAAVPPAYTEYLGRVLLSVVSGDSRRLEAE